MKIRFFTSNLVVAISFFAATLAAGPTKAAELIYQPIVPAFGGSPLYEDYLIGTAQLQNQHVPTSNNDGGGAPNIDFPDINIDLGDGLGGGGAPPVIIIPTPPTAAGG